MDPDIIPFNMLVVGLTNPGKMQFLMNQLCGPFCGRFDYIVLIYPTFAHNKMFDQFARFFLEGTNTLIVLDNCGASKDMKGQTSELVKLGFSARHVGISMRVLTQQLSSNAKPFRENVDAIMLYYMMSAKTTTAIIEQYAGNLSPKGLEGLERLIA